MFSIQSTFLHIYVSVFSFIRLYYNYFAGFVVCYKGNKDVHCCDAKKRTNSFQPQSGSFVTVKKKVCGHT